MLRAKLCPSIFILISLVFSLPLDKESLPQGKKLTNDEVYILSNLPNISSENVVLFQHPDSTSKDSNLVLPQPEYKLKVSNQEFLTDYDPVNWLDDNIKDEDIYH